MLNEKQKLVYNLVTSLNFKHLLVTGFGGVGKSYVLSWAILNLCRSNPTTNIAVVCPTRLAKDVFQSKFEKFLVEGEKLADYKVRFKTCASILQKVPFENEFLDVTFGKGKGDKLNKYDLIVVDESSMVPSYDIDLFLTHNRVIFSGDPLQLAPVKAPMSEIFTKDYPGVQHIELTQQMRSQGDVERLAAETRNSVQYPDSSSDNIFVHSSFETILDQFINDLKNAKGDDKLQYAFLTPTNKRVDQVSKRIIEDVFDGEYIREGNFLRLDQTFQFLSNGELLQIEKVFHFPNHSMWYVPHTQVEIKSIKGGRTLRLNIAENSAQLNQYLAQLKSTLKACRTVDTQLGKRLAAECRYRLRIIKSSFADVSVPFVSTIHRSQGQSIENVYVDTAGIHNSRGGNKRRLSYVAYSRSSHNLHTIKVNCAQEKIKYADLKEEFYERFPNSDLMEIRNKARVDNPGSYQGMKGLRQLLMEVLGKK